MKRISLQHAFVLILVSLAAYLFLDLPVRVTGVLAVGVIGIKSFLPSALGLVFGWCGVLGCVLGALLASLMTSAPVSDLAVECGIVLISGLSMVIGKALIKDHTQQGKDLGQVFTEVNDLLCESNSEGLFITAFEGVLDFATGEFQYVNAGHGPGVHRFQPDRRCPVRADGNQFHLPHAAVLQPPYTDRNSLRTAADHLLHGILYLTQGRERSSIMIPEKYQNYMFNEQDYLPQDYKVEDPEKLALIKQLVCMISDDLDLSKPQKIQGNEPDVWLLDRLLTKDEVKFMFTGEDGKLKAILPYVIKREFKIHFSKQK